MEEGPWPKERTLLWSNSIFWLAANFLPFTIVPNFDLQSVKDTTPGCIRDWSTHRENMCIAHWLAKERRQRERNNIPTNQTIDARCTQEKETRCHDVLCTSCRLTHIASIEVDYCMSSADRLVSSYKNVTICETNLSPHHQPAMIVSPFLPTIMSLPATRENLRAVEEC